MATPILLLLLMVLVAAGQIALGLVSTSQTAVLAARLAATRPDAVVADLLPDEVALTVDPPTATRRPGDLLTTTVVRDLEVLWWPGPGVTVRAESTALTEQVGP